MKSRAFTKNSVMQQLFLHLFLLGFREIVLGIFPRSDISRRTPKLVFTMKVTPFQNPLNAKTPGYQRNDNPENKNPDRN